MMGRLCNYSEKTFVLTDKLKALIDSRQAARIPTRNIWLSVLLMNCTGLPSLNAFEQQARMPRRWRKVIGERIPSADRIGDVMCLMDPEPTRMVHRHCLYKLKRNKVLKSPWSINIMAIDGHEFFSLKEALL